MSTDHVGVVNLHTIRICVYTTILAFSSMNITMMLRDRELAVSHALNLCTFSSIGKGKMESKMKQPPIN